MKQTKKPTATSRHSFENNVSTPTFMEHVRELQGRLFWTAMAFVGVSALAYPFFDTIVQILVAPLDASQQLVYLTPGGAFGFVIKVCISIGLIGALPVLVYHVYRFIAPSVQRLRPGRVFGYALASLGLAIVGILFAYFLSLPSALYFLTNFDLQQIAPMLTIDAYFSFVISYLLAGALLFQLPLFMLIGNSVRPFTPGRFMKYQRHVIVASFIFAAVISPTPDALNQALLAVPLVFMYQVGGLLVWLQNRHTVKKHARVGCDATVPVHHAVQSLQGIDRQPGSVRAQIARLRPAVGVGAGPVTSSPASPPVIIATTSQAPQQTRGQLATRPRCVDSFSRPPSMKRPALGSSQRLSSIAMPAPRTIRRQRSLDGFSFARTMPVA